jgi:hypothetical protein
MRSPSLSTSKRCVACHIFLHNCLFRLHVDYQHLLLFCIFCTGQPDLCIGTSQVSASSVQGKIAAPAAVSGAKGCNPDAPRINQDAATNYFVAKTGPGAACVACIKARRKPMKASMGTSMCWACIAERVLSVDCDDDYAGGTISALVGHHHMPSSVPEIAPFALCTLFRQQSTRA